MSLLLVDAANVVGSRPDGWWRDRAGAAARLCAQVQDAVRAGRLEAPVVAVLEGVARRGAPEADQGGVRIVHAPGEGDARLVELAAPGCVLVSADRALAARLRTAGGSVVGPHWLLDRLAVP